MITSNHYYSLIFKNIETEGNTFVQNLKSIFLNGFNGIFASLKTQDFSFTNTFSTSLEQDRAALLAYREAINNNVPATEAFEQTMTGASVAAQEFAKNNEVNILGIQNFTKAQKISAVEMMAQNKSFANCKTLINEYSNGCKNCGLSQEQFAAAVGKSNPALAKYLSGLNGAKGSLGGYIASLVSSKVATIALQAVTIALNMALTMGISVALQALITGLNNFIHSAKNASEAADELKSKSMEEAQAAQEEVAQLDKLIEKYKKLATSDTQDSSTRNEIRDVQSQIADLVGQQANNLDLVNGKLDEEYNKLLQIQQQTANKAVETATSSYHNAKDSANKVIGQDSALWVDGYAYVSDDWWSNEDDVIKILQDNGYKNSVQKGGAFNSHTFIMDSMDEDYNQIVGAAAKAEYLQGMIDTIKDNYSDYASSDIYNSLIKQRDAYLEYVNDMNKAAQTLADAVITASTYDSELAKISVNSAETFGTYRDKLIEIVKNSPDLSEALTNGDITESDIESRVTSYLSTLSQFSDYYNEWKSSLEGDTTTEVPKISFSDLIGDDSSFTERVDDYIEKVTTLKEALSDFQKGDFSNEDFVDLIKQFPELADNADNLDEAITTLLASMNTSMMHEFAAQFGNMDTDEDVAALRNFQDAVLELGKVVGNTEFAIDIDTEIDGMDKLFTAMKESVSSTGLTSESIKNLQSRYQDLENYDAARLFEKTANGIHLNTKALRELESAYEKQEKANIKDTLDGLIEQYNDLTEQINNAGDAASTSELYAKRQDILDQINDTATLAAQYDGLTSAFRKWEEAQSIGEEGDMYDSLAGSLEDIKQLYDDGLIGTNQFRTAVQLMSNQDLSTASIDELLAAYESGYSVMTKYFTDSSDGCLNFLNDVQKLNSEWVHMNEDGSWDINFGVGDDQDVADALGINVEAVQAIMRKLSDYGFDINLDSIFSQLDNLQSRAEEANQALIDIGATDITFNFGTDDINYLNEQIEQSKDLLNSLYNDDGELNVKYNEDDVENAIAVIERLIYRKQSLDDAAILKVDTSTADSDITNIISKLQEFKSSYNNLEVQTAIGADTTEAQTACDGLLTEISGMDAEILATLGIDTTSLDTLNSTINAITPEVMVKAGLDASLIEGYQASEHNAEGTVIWDNNIDKITSWINQSHTASGTVNWSNNTNNVKTHFTASGTINWSSSGKAQGTAYVNGNWGTKDSGVALGGEVGQELVVRNGKFFTIGEDGAEFFAYKKNDIIFNAEQTRQIFANGKITNGKKRGVTYATGTAFSSGSGRITGGGKVITTPTGGGSSSSGGSSGSSSSTKEDEPKKVDWIEIAIERIERAINKLKKTAESTYKSLKTRSAAASKEISKVNEELSLQQKAYDRYIQEANSVGLSSDLAAKVRDGTIDINEYDSETQELISDYQEWYEKALDCADAIDDLHESLASLYEDNFNNIQTDFDNQLSLLEHLSNTYETGMDKLEAQGRLGSTEYYAAMNDVEKKNLKTLNNELNSLTQSFSDAMASGEIEEYSEAWYAMQQSINDTKEAIDEATLSILENEKAMRELEWSYFDYIQDRISQITQESNFLIDLMSNSNLYEDNGQLNDNGMATMGLHAQNYNVYMAQADQYAQEILKLDEEIAKDPYNTDLIERREELLGLQQDSILAAEDEKQAIVDLVREGINIELQALQDLIDAYTDSLDSAKDLYEYQKKIEEQTTDIANLQKQLSAYENDTSEENRARVQQIKVDLAEAQEKLAETEYDQFVTETKKLLDDLYDEYEEILNERLDNVDALLSDMIDAVNTNSASISETLITESDKVGYTMTEGMKSIWSNDGAASAIVAKYGDNFSGQLTTVNQVLSGISTNVAKMVAESDQEAQETVETTTPTTAPSTPSTPSTPSKPPTTPTTNTKFNEDVKRGVAAAIWIYGGSKSGWGNDPDRKKRLTAKFGASNAAAVQSYINAHGSNGDLYKYWTSTGKNNLSKYYYSAFKTGGLADYTGFAWMDGTPNKPELVLNAKDTENFIGLRDILRDMSQDTLSINNPNYSGFDSSKLSGLTDISGILAGISVRNGDAGNSIGEINITIPIDHVENYDDFVNQLRQDKKFEQLIQSMTVDRLTGGSSLAKNKYKW